MIPPSHPQSLLGPSFRIYEISSHVIESGMSCAHGGPGMPKAAHLGTERRNEIYFQQVKVELCWLRPPHPLSTQPLKQQENHDIPLVSLMRCHVWHLEWIKSPCRNFGCWSLRRQMAQEDTVQTHREEGCRHPRPPAWPASISLMLAPEWT